MTAGNYVGVDVNTASRITALGHGGQIVASAATREAVQATSGRGVRFVALGAHRAPWVRQADAALPDRVRRASRHASRPCGRELGRRRAAADRPGAPVFAALDPPGTLPDTGGSMLEGLLTIAGLLVIVGLALASAFAVRHRELPPA